MKNLCKILLVISFITGTVQPVFVFADDTKAPLCTRVDEVAGRVLAKITLKEETALDQGNVLLKKIGDLKKDQTAKILSGRGQGDDAMVEYFKLLDDRANTKDEVKAVVVFKKAIRTAKKAERAAVDTALTAYYDGLRVKIKERNEGVVDTFTSFKASVKTVFSKAKQDCAQGVDTATIRTEVDSGIKAARVVFESLIKTYTLHDDVSKLITTRTEAFKEAEDAYLAKVTTAKATLQSILTNQ